MAKQTLETFTLKVIEKHGDKYDFSKSEYEGLEKEITYVCPIHGEVTQLAKKVLTHTGCPECDKEKAKKAHKSGKYAKQKGNRYELQIVNELKELGYEGCVSSRSQDKRADANKCDIVDMNGELPMNIQNKITQNTPNYFKIADECTDKSKPFTLFWNRQEAVEGKVSMNSKGEVVFVPKDFFYTLLKCYKEHGN